jgi:penicillin V acylase-like amidase (Ntn superfamily)
MPGSLTSLDRFVRSDILLSSLPKPDSLSEALYQADLVLSSLSYYPAYNNKEAGGATIWRVIKDLDNKVVYTSNLVYYQGGNKIAPTALTNRNYTIIDLKQIDFNQIPEEYQDMVFKPTPTVKVKFLASAAQAMPSLVFTEEARK